MAPGVAFFDLDHTLLPHNSGVLFARAALSLGRISPLDMLRSVWWATLHRSGHLDVHLAYRRAGALFRGLLGEQLRHEVRYWFNAEVAHLLRSGGRRALEAHRARGDRTVLITNSSSYIAESACEAWAMDSYLANEILVDAQGRITGEVGRPLCYGVGKLRRAKDFATAHQLSLKDASFYSDSSADLPLLERVRWPVAVHPDRRLFRVARQRAWPVVHWTTH